MEVLQRCSVLKPYIQSPFQSPNFKAYIVVSIFKLETYLEALSRSPVNNLSVEAQHPSLYDG
jgi:hypothetical protein